MADWDGGLGTIWRNDPSEQMITTLLTNAAWTSARPPHPALDFLTGAPRDQRRTSSGQVLQARTPARRVQAAQPLIWLARIFTSSCVAAGRVELDTTAPAELMYFMNLDATVLPSYLNILQPDAQPCSYESHCRWHHARRTRLPHKLVGFTRMKCAGTPSIHGSSPAPMIGARSASVSR
jgi:hypothetical protein